MATQFTREEVLAEIERRKGAADDTGMQAALAPAITREEVLAEIERRKRRSAPPAASESQSRKSVLNNLGVEFGEALAGKDAKGLGAVGAQARTAGLGFTSGLFGFGDRIVREEIAGQLRSRNIDISDEELSGVVRTAMRTAFETRPAAYTPGFAVGSFGGGGAVAKGVGRAGAAVGLGKGAPAFGLSGLAGSTAKAAGGGAGAAALQTVVAENRAPTTAEAGFGAGFGAGFRLLGAGARRAYNAVSDRFGRGADKAAARNLLAETSDLDAVAERAARIQGDSQVAPSFVEALPEKAAAKVGAKIGEASGKAQDILESGVGEAISGRGGRLTRAIASTVEVSEEAAKSAKKEAQASITGLRKADAEATRQARQEAQERVADQRLRAADRVDAVAKTGARAIDKETAARNADADAALGNLSSRLGNIKTAGRKATAASEEARQQAASKTFGRVLKNRNVLLTPKEAKALLEYDTAPHLPRSPNEPGKSVFRGRLEEAVENESAIVVSANDLDHLRQSLAAGSTKGAFDAEFADGARKVRSLLADKVPSYDRTLTTLASHAERVKGMKLGENLFSSAKTGDTLSSIKAELANPDIIAGFEEAASRRIQTVAKSPRATVAFAKRLADDDDLFEKVSLGVGDKTARELRDTAAKLVDAQNRAKTGPAEVRERARALVKQQRLALNRRIAKAARDARRIRPNPRPAGIDAAEAKLSAADKRLASVKTGKAAAAGDTSAEVQAMVAKLDPAQAKEAAYVAEQAMADMARGGNDSSARLARSLAEDRNLQHNLSLVLGDKAGTLSKTAQSELDRARSAAVAGIAARRGAGKAQMDKATIDAVADIGILSGSTSRPFMISALRRLYNRTLGVTPAAAKRMAQKSVRPGGAMQVIEELRKAGVSEAKIRQAYTSAAIGLAQAGGSSASLKEEEK